MIGVFDSGVGGLSVWKELVKIIPNESYCYVSDSGYCPYGPRPKEEVIERAEKITNYLIANGAKVIVVACNTATAAAIDYLRSKYDIPFIGMEPALKPAALNTHTGVIGVLATKGTFKGELYLRTLHKFAANTVVIEQIGEGLVEAVENDNLESEATSNLLKKYLVPMINQEADHLVLGCTHYPFLINAIRDIVGDKMEIVNPAPAVAKRVVEIVNGLDDISNVEFNTTFVTTGSNLPLINKMVHTIVPECADGYYYKEVII